MLYSLNTKFEALTINKVGETGVGWDRGWVGQRGFEYVPDTLKMRFFYQISTLPVPHFGKKFIKKFKIFEEIRGKMLIFTF